MSSKRVLITTLVIILLAAFLVGCAAKAQDATFIGYKKRPTSTDSAGIAIVQLASGTPVEAECRYESLENGTPVMVEDTGDGYKVISISPDWTTQ
jgi:hypothetical protein